MISLRSGQHDLAVVITHCVCVYVCVPCVCACVFVFLVRVGVSTLQASRAWHEIMRSSSP